MLNSASQKVLQLKFSKCIWISILSAGLMTSTGALTAEPELQLNPNSLDLIRQELGFETARAQIQQKLWAADAKENRLRVAILDKGFRDWESRRGQSLPKRTRYIAGPLKTMNSSPHGTLMAEILTTLVAGPEWQSPNMERMPFDLYLINVGGFSNFKAAIQTLIDENVDIVLYSEVWELGGNGDGRGFINAEVSKAVDHGILWINAAGNFNGRTYNGGIVVGDNDLVELPDEKNSLKVLCEPPEGESECTMKATLTWNDFQDDSNKGTRKDLDLGLFDDKMKPVQISRNKQVDIEGEAPMGESKYPREALGATLKKGTYYLRVRSKQRSWTDEDRLRILVDGDSLNVPSGSRRETLQNPADHPRVVTVGGSDAIRSSVSIELSKPELVVRSSVTEKFGKEFRGSSNAAAIVAAGAILVKYMDRDLDREQILDRVSGGHPIIGAANWGWRDLGLLPPPGCLQAVEKTTGIKAIDQVLKNGGMWVETPLGPKILVSHAVNELQSGISINAPAQSLWVGDKGFKVLTRGQWSQELSRSVEVLQRPQGTAICNDTVSTKSFSLSY